jgi:hypothetical protein
MKCRAVFAITVVFFAGCAGHVPAKRTTLNAPAAATVSAKAGPADLYPDAQLTPGVTNPEVTQANIKETVCKAGWTATARPPASYTNNLKKEGITTRNLRTTRKTISFRWRSEEIPKIRIIFGLSHMIRRSTGRRSVHTRKTKSKIS